MKHIKDVLNKLINKKIDVDEAEGWIDFFIMRGV